MPARRHEQPGHIKAVGNPSGRHDLDRSPARATLQCVEPAHVTLTGDLSGDYVVEDRRPDGRVLLRPDLSVKAMLARHGERKLTTEEFEQHFGQLPRRRGLIGGR
jgi:hypothetical protein